MAAKKKTARKPASRKTARPAKKARKGVAAIAKKALKRYQSMRDFALTAEPSGHRPVAAAKRLRYVIQKHEATRLHYDFRLELNGTFKSWAVTRGPSLTPQISGWRWRWKTIRSTMAISKAPSQKVNMAGAR